MRGDGPRHLSGSSSGSLFSPRAWGWSGDARRAAEQAEVLPTCVGMVRQISAELDKLPGSPHVRGDGPITLAIFRNGSGFSPRAWGWSVNDTYCWPTMAVLPTCVGMVRDARPHRRAGRVLPTCVGMVRPSVRAPKMPAGSPHVRGDGPHRITRSEAAVRFSPRAWGWSCAPDQLCNQRDVLPTCVGMVRQCTLSIDKISSSPHVRGDGPRSL